MRIATKSTALATMTLCVTIFGSAHATAQNVIPGDNSPARTVVVDPSKGVVSVSPSGAESVSFTFRNLTGTQLRCKDEDNSYSSVATEPDTAAKVMAYYANFGVKADPVIPIAVSSVAIPVDLTPALLLLPGGSLAPIFGNNYAALADIKASHENSAQRGHVGQITPFTVNNNTVSSTFTIPISPPAAGPRTDWDAAVVITCQSTASDGQWYAFAGYENGPPVEPTGGFLNIGSLGRY